MNKYLTFRKCNGSVSTCESWK